MFFLLGMSFIWEGEVVDMVPIVVSIIGFFSAVVVSIASSIITLYVQSERVKSEYKKVSLEFKKELASRLNEKKWEVYSGYIAWTSERISHIGGNDPHNARQIYEELSKINADMVLVASDDVLKMHEEFYLKIVNHYEETGEIVPFKIRYEYLGGLINSMRKDLGYKITLDEKLPGMILEIPNLYNSSIK